MTCQTREAKRAAFLGCFQNSGTVVGIERQRQAFPALVHMAPVQAEHMIIQATLRPETVGVKPGYDTQLRITLGRGTKPILE